MAVVAAKVITLSRNEHDLIEDFVEYYAFLFGPSNVVIVDNGSDDPRVLAAYDKYRAQGVVVESETSRDMRDMAQIVTDAMRRHSRSCEFLLPLDTDEFLFLPGSPSTTDPETVRSMVHAELARVPPDVSVLRYAQFLGSVADPRAVDYVDRRHRRPARHVTTFRDQGWDKLIVRAPAFRSISQGNHHAEVSWGSTARSSLLGLLHFHETGAARKLERCVMSMRGYRQLHQADDGGGGADTQDRQLATCDAIIARRGFGGHRVEQYRIFVLRRIACREFREAMGRYPTIEELARILASLPATPIDAVTTRKRLRSAALATCDIMRINPSASEQEEDALVLHDPEPPRDAIVVTQLRRILGHPALSECAKRAEERKTV